MASSFNRGGRYLTHAEKKAECQLLAKRMYRMKHGDRLNASRARYDAARIQATPLWANEFFISEAYALASLRGDMLGFPWEVDHIVPLRSKRVCGLHTEVNLQVIESKQNNKKGNRYWPDM